MTKNNSNNENKENPIKGRKFQELVAESLSKEFNSDFNLDYPIPIGYYPTLKAHKFDCVSKFRYKLSFT